MLNIIDISKWQGNINISALNPKPDGIFVKATEGVGYVDPFCDINYQKAKKITKKLGIYHFARPSYKNSAVDEANFFLRNTEGYWKNRECLIMLDWEDAIKSDVNWAKTWLDRVYQVTGMKPLIYMNPWVTIAYNWSEIVKEDYGLWIAKYRDMIPDYNFDMSNAGAKPVVKYWSFYAFWQWTSSGRLGGYNGNLDCNIFYGDFNTWDKYLGKTQNNQTNSNNSAPVVDNIHASVEEKIVMTQEQADALNAQHKSELLNLQKQIDELRHQSIQNKTEVEQMAQERTSALGELKLSQDNLQILKEEMQKTVERYNNEKDRTATLLADVQNQNEYLKNNGIFLNYNENEKLLLQIASAGVVEELKANGIKEKWQVWVDSKFKSNFMRSLLKYDIIWIIWQIMSHLLIILPILSGSLLNIQDPQLKAMLITGIEWLNAGISFLIKFMLSNLDKNKDGKLSSADFEKSVVEMLNK